MESGDFIGMEMITAALTLAFFALFSSKMTYVASNLCLLITSSQSYFIPNQSFVFKFHALLLNEDSGGWWINGPDSRMFYYNHPKISYTNNSINALISKRPSPTSKCVTTVGTFQIGCILSAIENRIGKCSASEIQER